MNVYRVVEEIEFGWYRGTLVWAASEEQALQLGIPYLEDYEPDYTGVIVNIEGACTSGPELADARVLIMYSADDVYYRDAGWGEEGSSSCDSCYLREWDSIPESTLCGHCLLCRECAAAESRDTCPECKLPEGRVIP